MFFGFESVTYMQYYSELICFFLSRKLCHMTATLMMQQPLLFYLVYFSMFLNSFVPTYGQVHDANVMENPFSGYKIGQTVKARIVAKPNEADSKRNTSGWELSVRPELITGRRLF